MNPLVVKKFGGTSVGTLDRIRVVAEQLMQAKRAGERLVVVVSAMSGETDRLLNLAYELSSQPASRELAVLMTTGEQVSMSLLALLLCEKGFPARSYNAAQLSIKTDDVHTKASLLSIETKKIEADLAAGYIVVVAGFQGVSLAGDVTALGRGGSDTSAVALACALKAKECQIFTDVEGIYTADPRIVPNARLLETIDFNTMLTLASLGSKVLQWRSVALAGKYKIPLRVLSSFTSSVGTLMNHMSHEALEAPQFSGLSHQTQLKRWNIKIENSQGNELASIAAELAKKNIHLEHIGQTMVGQQCNIAVIVGREEQLLSEPAIQSLVTENHWYCQSETHLARVALVGLGLHSHAWVAAQFMGVLYQLNIKLQDVIYSELALSVIISEASLGKAMQALHAAFFE